MYSKKDSSMKIMRNLHCVNCNSQFFFKDFSPKGSKCPYLLHCGHSVCEFCLHQSLRESQSIICSECNVISLANPLGENKTDFFPLSIYTLGKLLFLQSHKLEKDKKLEALVKNYENFYYSFKRQPDSNLQAEPGKSLCEECSLTACWFCENCKSNFCEMCWGKVHGSAKSLMKHCKTSVCMFEKTGNKKCPHHETQDLEFFCKSCSIIICSHCIILQHQGEGHCPVTLKEKNLEMINKVKSSADFAELIKKRMKHTLKKVQLSQSSYETIGMKLIADTETQIIKTFARLHGLLQLEEERCLKKLHEKVFERENRLKALGKQLETQIKSVESLLSECDWAFKKPQFSDLTQLQSRLDEVINMPCYLISQTINNERKTKVTFDESLIESVHTYCSIEVSSSEVFELRSSADLPQDYAVEPLDYVEPIQEQKPFAASSLSDNDSLSNCSLQGFTKEDPEMSSLSKGPLPPKVFLERRNYSVRVTHIKNPEEFYILPTSRKNRQEAMEMRAFQYANGLTDESAPKAVAKDEIYLVQYSLDRRWYRGRVVKMSEDQVNGEEAVVIYYLDYGDTEVVALSRLRPTPADLLEEPPLAVKCKLFDCVPRNEKWCQESTRTMEKILNNYTATMFVMKVHPDCLEIDLSVVYPEGEIGRDIVSVRDALLFLEFSSFVNGSKIPQNATAMKYMHQILPSCGETFSAFITYVNSPSDFYVQRTKQDTSYLCKLTMDLQSFYEENSHKGMIYNPVVGMPCAALFSVDQVWYRAKIVDVPGRKMVTVLYVDYGNKETIPWNRIRKLRENFIRRPPLALKCTLAGIRPVNDEWNVQAKSYMDKCVLVKNCRIQIHAKPHFSKKLKVLLYKKIKNKEICVNSLFVEMGYATEVNASTAANNEAGSKAVEEEAMSEVEKTMSASVKDTISDAENDCEGKQGDFNKRRKNKLSAKKLRELYEKQKKKINQPSSAEEMENEVDEYDNVFKVKVDVLSSESPSCIYVTFPALTEELTKLQQKLNDFYKNSTFNTAKEWTVGCLCAVYHSSKCNWYRASLRSLLPNNQVKVFLKDVAEEATEPMTALRELDPSFTKYATCAVKCHLADIGPPGEQWPSITSEHLNSELENYKDIYMTKKGQIENKSLPIELWVKKIVPRGALEPIGKEWVTLNKLLVSQGLAIPKKLKSWYADRKFNDEDSEEVAESKVFTPATVEMQVDEKFKETLHEVLDNCDLFPPSVNAKWPPPEPLKKQEFVGIPTYVDFDAVIYIQNIEEDGEKLEAMCATLMEDYGNSKPLAEDQFWSPGQLCIARYHVDNCWYRGVIQQTNKDMSYEVHFIDYGNTETCQVADLRKRIQMHDVPILTHKFRLDGVLTASKDGKWPVAVIEILHSIMVDKKCKVTVTKIPKDPNDVHMISLKIMEDDLEISTFLIDQGLAVMGCSDTKTLDIKDVSLNDSSKSQRVLKRKNEFAINEYEKCDRSDVTVKEEFD